MNRREMRRTIFTVIATCLPGYNPTRGTKKTLEEALEDELLLICKFKTPNNTTRRRWQFAIHEVQMQMFDKYKDE
tara:strand:- start:1087 stop:1311 length:225 start_codon:yes stop_codon:yes gene_type:complete